MTAWAITMAKDEADILRYTVEHMLTQVDRVFISDNLSTDGTSDIICGMVNAYNGRVVSEVDPVVAYNQAQKMTDLAHRVGRIGATWIVPFDADEAWFLPDLANEPYDVIQAVQHIYVPCAKDDPDEPDPLRRIEHRQPGADWHPKVAFRYSPHARLHMGNHDVTHPSSRRRQAATIRHYMYRSFGQALHKVANGVAAYQASDLSPEYGVHWHWLHSMGPTGQEVWWREYTCQPLEWDPWPA